MSMRRRHENARLPLRLPAPLPSLRPTEGSGEVFSHRRFAPCTVQEGFLHFAPCGAPVEMTDEGSIPAAAGIQTGTRPNRAPSCPVGRAGLNRVRTPRYRLCLRHAAGVVFWGVGSRVDDRTSSGVDARFPLPDLAADESRALYPPRKPLRASPADRRESRLPRTPIRGAQSHERRPCRATLGPGPPLRSVRGGTIG